MSRHTFKHEVVRRWTVSHPTCDDATYEVATGNVLSGFYPASVPYSFYIASPMGYVVLAQGAMGEVIEKAEETFAEVRGRGCTVIDDSMGL